MPSPASPAPRYWRWAAWLLPVFVLSYALLDTWLEGPCSDSPQNYRRWLLNLGLLGGFALHSLGVYFLGLSRRYLALAMTLPWVWHLLALSPFLLEWCGHPALHAHLRAELGFWTPEWLAASALAAALSSLALHACYRRWNPPGRRAVLGGVALSALLLAAVMHALLPSLESLYGGAGAALPGLSAHLAWAYPYWSLPGLLCWAVFFYSLRRAMEPPPRWLRPATVALLAWLNLSLGLFSLALFSPGLSLCTCIL